MLSQVVRSKKTTTNMHRLAGLPSCRSIINIVKWYYPPCTCSSVLSSVNYIPHLYYGDGHSRRFTAVGWRSLVRYSWTTRPSPTTSSPADSYLDSCYLHSNKNVRKLRRQFYPARNFGTFRYCHSENVIDEECIRMWTELTTEHLTPEVKLHLITQRCRLWHSRGEDSPFVDPFWAFYWPGGQALSRYILDNPNELRAKRVLDVGSGCGASAIAASMVGAEVVIANDIDLNSATAIQLNASTNRVNVTVDTRNLIGQYDPSWDVVVIGDMFYDTEFAKLLETWVKVLIERNVTIFIGDPGRASFKSTFSEIPMKQVFTAELCETSAKENNGFYQTSVWKCLPKEPLT